MIPVADAVPVIIVMTAMTVIIATIIKITNPAITMMFIGMTPIIVDRIDTRIAEKITAHHGALLIVPETVSIKSGLVMIKDVPAVPVLVIQIFKNLL